MREREREGGGGGRGGVGGYKQIGMEERGGKKVGMQFE
jgi:hypothetical protein